MEHSHTHQTNNGTWAQEQRALEQTRRQPQPENRLVDSRRLQEPPRHLRYDQQVHTELSRYGRGREVEPYNVQPQSNSHVHQQSYGREMGGVVRTTDIPQRRFADNGADIGLGTPQGLVQLVPPDRHGSPRTQEMRPHHRMPPAHPMINAAGPTTPSLMTETRLSLAPRDQALPSVEGTRVSARAQQANHRQDNEVIIISSPPTGSAGGIIQHRGVDRLQHVLMPADQDSGRSYEPATKSYPYTSQANSYDAHHVTSPTRPSQYWHEGSERRYVYYEDPRAYERPRGERRALQVQQPATNLPMVADRASPGRIGPLQNSLTAHDHAFTRSHHDSLTYASSRQYMVQEPPRETILVRESRDPLPDSRRVVSSGGAGNPALAIEPSHLDSRNHGPYTHGRTISNASWTEVQRPRDMPIMIEDRTPALVYRGSGSLPQHTFIDAGGARPDFRPNPGYVVRDERPAQVYSETREARGPERDHGRLGRRDPDADIIVLE